MHELNEKLKFFSQNAANILKEICFKNDFAKNSAFNQKIDALLSDEYKNYHNVFNQKKINKFSPHHQYDHQIKLTDEGIPL